MSQRQCCVWGYHNRKGRYIEDITGNRLRGCPELEVNGCPKPQLLTLHKINNMPKHVQRALVAKIYLMRQGPGGRKWNPNKLKDTVICNIHYVDCKGPTREDRELLPINFKRPSHFSTPLPSKKSRHEIDSARSSMVPELNESLAVDCAAGGTNPLQAGGLGTSQAGGLGTSQAGGLGT